VVGPAEVRNGFPLETKSLPKDTFWHILKSLQNCPFNRISFAGVGSTKSVVSLKRCYINPWLSEWIHYTPKIHKYKYVHIQMPTKPHINPYIFTFVRHGGSLVLGTVFMQYQVRFWVVVDLKNKEALYKYLEWMKEYIIIYMCAFLLYLTDERMRLVTHVWK